jgi:hypothetical protein
MGVSGSFVALFSLSRFEKAFRAKGAVEVRDVSRPCLISSDGEESTTARASEASRESEHEIQTGKARQFNIIWFERLTLVQEEHLDAFNSLLEF